MKHTFFLFIFALATSCSAVVHYDATVITGDRNATSIAIVNVNVIPMDADRIPVADSFVDSRSAVTSRRRPASRRAAVDPAGRRPARALRRRSPPPSRSWAARTTRTRARIAGRCRRPAPRLSDYRIGYLSTIRRAPSRRTSASAGQGHRGLRSGGRGWRRAGPRACNRRAVRRLSDPAVLDLRARGAETRSHGLRRSAANQDGSYAATLGPGLTAPRTHYRSANGLRMRAARGIWQAYFRTHDAFLMPTASCPRSRTTSPATSSPGC